MPAPKLLRIVNELAERASQMRVANGYYSDMGETVLRDRQPPHAAQLPCVQIYVGERTQSDTRNRRAAADMPITVIGYRMLGGNESEQVGIEILADIQQALEAGDERLGGLLNGATHGLHWSSDQIYLPESGESVVAAEVTYAAPHVRHSGDPEII